MPHRRQFKGACGWSCFLSLLITVAGCGGNPATVSGVVTMDGQPLQRGKVGFTPTSGGLQAMGQIDSDGSYELSTNLKPGLQVGEYQATVISTEPGIADPNGGPPMPGKSLIPRRYARTSTSDLNFTVERGSNVIDIELSSEGLEDNPNMKTRRRSTRG